MSERKTLMARAKELGLPGRGTNDELKKAIAEKEANPASNPAPPSNDAELVDAIVLDQLKHNGKSYGPDEPVELTQKQFDRLEHLGVVAAAEAD